MEICSREYCTGCTACMAICPKGCITMVEDEIGHFFPQIDEKICVNCGACKKVCPSINDISKNRPQKAYAAISKDNEDYLSSSSGGAASVLSNFVVKNGGIVYGCTGTNGYDVCHIRIDKADELWKLKGSKYVESRLGDTFKSIKKDIADGKNVLFIGTPCQTAGAKSLFSNKENFYAVDLICHGVPSQKLLKEHLENVSKEVPDEIKFRDREGFYLQLNKNGRQIKKISHFSDLYYAGFFKTLYYRKSCYSCMYAKEERCSDITIGDFWGIKSTEINAKNGLSVVLVNTEKGKKLLEECKDKFVLEEHQPEEAILGNPQLRRPSFPHKNSDKFRKFYPKMGFKKAANRCLLVNRVKYFILFVLQNLLKR